MPQFLLYFQAGFVISRKKRGKTDSFAVDRARKVFLSLSSQSKSETLGQKIAFRPIPFSFSAFSGVASRWMWPAEELERDQEQRSHRETIWRQRGVCIYGRLYSRTCLSSVLPICKRPCEKRRKILCPKRKQCSFPFFLFFFKVRFFFFFKGQGVSVCFRSYCLF